MSNKEGEIQMNFPFFILLIYRYKYFTYEL